jgi:hypothetical protein
MVLATKKPASAGFFYRPRLTRKISSKINKAAPTLMALSATLKAGKCQRPQ